jgi:hypothetical protein
MGTATNHAKADKVFTNGRLYTVDPERSWAEAVAISDGEIVYVGDDVGGRAFIGDATEVTDLGGKLMLPGFHDSHVHLYAGGANESCCVLTDAATQAEALEMIQDSALAKGDRAGGWIVCNGLNKGLIPDLNRRLLDEVSSECPIYVMTDDGHSCWLNSRGLEIAGIDASTEDPPQGEIVRFPGTKEPNGFLHDYAAELGRDAIPQPTHEERIDHLKTGIGLAHKFGITSILEPGVDDELMAPYLALSDRGELTLRVMASISPINWQPGAFGDEVYTFVAKRDDYRRPNINPDSLKVYIDGVTENGSAVLLEPYLVPELNGKKPFYTQEELNKYVCWADAEGLQVHLHAIGDGGMRMGLNAYEFAKNANGETGNRHHICHVQMVDPDDVHRFGELGVAATFQPLWAYPDPVIVNLCIPFLGEERLKKFYLINSIHKTGGLIVGGSDWFVTSLNPLDAIEVGVRRQDPHMPEGSPALNPEEAVDLATMIEAYTINGAYTLHQDERVGSIEVGKRADLIVLDRNLFEIPATEINETKVVLTLFDGREVYSA